MKARLSKQNLMAAAIIFAAFSAAIFCVACQPANENTASMAFGDARRGEKELAIESALFARVEFFGAKAIVPFPTAEARTRLSALLEKYPHEPQILFRLAQLEEQLADYENAERHLQAFVELNAGNQPVLEELAAYYGRRARFERQAEILEKMLRLAPEKTRAEIFGQLVETARIHKLEKYLKPEFYRQIIAENPGSFAVVEDFIGKLFAEKRYDEALDVLRQNRQNFPEKRGALLEKEIEILLAAGRSEETEAVYHQSFDAFWDDKQVESYYTFLRENNRLRAYGQQLKGRLKQNPTDFDAAVRLFHFKKYDYDAAPEIFLRLEKARAEKGVNWSAEELLTVSRLLIASGKGDAASRFLYTLLTKHDLPAKSDLRAKILYQLFELLSDAGEERLVLTRGDLKFYRDVAASDPHPGITTGLLSLIFSDTNPAHELAVKEQTAVKYFNRAAAYRIFQAYKEENPASPELAQMYLDIVRLYAASGETEIAAKTLAEFEQRPEFAESGAPAYPRIALKLADAFIAAKNPERERAVYRRLLDYLGKKQTAGKALVESSAQNSSDPTQVKPATLDYPFDSNPGIDVSEKTKEVEVDYYSSEPSRYRDFLNSENEEITYSDVLKRAVAALAKDNKTEEILALYAAEIEKYPNEAGLYEETLQWLGQTNLVEEQLKIYKRAVQKFPETSWRDRLARWFLKQERKREFETYSRELLGKLGDAEAGQFLAEFVDGKVSAQPDTFDSKLYLGFYTLAHRRFPHNLKFVEGLLKYYKTHNREAEWRSLAAEYYFVSPEIRNAFLNELSKGRELRQFLDKARAKSEERGQTQNALAALPYKLFRADAEVRLSNYEEAVEAYRELNALYPNKPEFAGRFVAFTRSLGQRQKRFLAESAEVARNLADAFPDFAEYRTQAGEIRAESGDYEAARSEWQKLIETARGEPETYRAAATVFWDYFQYDDALATIERLRGEVNDPTVYAFEAGAIYEAKHDRAAALAEYVKALDGSTPFAQNVVASDRAKKRLETLYRRQNVPAELETAFETERKRRSDDSTLVLGYADFLRRVENWDAAAQILKSEIASSFSKDFLTETRELCSIANDGETERLALKRLGETAKNRRAAIKYRLELAESFNNEDHQAAVRVLSELLAEYPTNYGVLDETSEFYWRIGRRDDALRVLQAAMQRGRGSYRTTFGRRLAGRFLSQNRLPEAEKVLTGLYSEDALDAGVYQELANIYVRTGDRAGLDRIFQKTLAEIKAQDIQIREIRDSVAELRRKMINAFTRLKDYNSAVEQHIEIINQEPESDENVEAAVSYVKRYGGADKLLEYYRQTAETAYKNYRWFVVLARIYESNKDFDAAAQNYKTAIENQPEMVELYNALADVYLEQKNADAAIETLSKTLELTNDEPNQVRRLIAVLEKAGRRVEAEQARQKLPVEEKPKLDLRDQFAEAARLKHSERAKAVEMYRQAFAALEANPLAQDLKSADIVGYVHAVRSQDALEKINERLWQLREKLIRAADRENSTEAGKARERLAILDGAITEGIGSAAREFATGNERAALIADFSRRIDAALKASDRHGALSLLHNLSRKSGFGQLEERILLGQKDAAFALKNSETYHNRLNDLINFYRERGDFNTVLNLLDAERRRDFEPTTFEYLPQIAETARLAGDREKELNALREYFSRKCEGCFAAQPDLLVERYFEFLAENGEAGKSELRGLVAGSSEYQIQLINFLIARGEKELAHAAIENAQLPETWRLARQAQTSLVFNEFAQNNQNYFITALHIKPIGELVKETPAAETQITGDDWFRLANDYGKWLRKADRLAQDSEIFLPAVVENRPHDAGEQARLGRWYLEQKDARRAIEHFEIALDASSADKNLIADLGAAYFLAGDAQKADQLWTQILENEAVSGKSQAADSALGDYRLYLEILGKHGRGAEAREKLFPIIVATLNEFYRENPYADAEDKEFETVAQQIRLLADSFGDSKDAPISAEKAAFFLKLSEAVGEEDRLVPAFLIKESMIARHDLTSFYELLIRRNESAGGTDYTYTDLLKNTFSAEIAQDALDAENDYEIEEPGGERLKWQKEFLAYLLEKRKTARAREIIASIERDLERRYARPVWLRLAKLEADVIDGKAADAMPEFKRFVGVAVSPDAPKIIAPSTERLNDSVNLLRREKMNAEADELQQAVYARFLALEQFDVSTFAGLAEIAFRRSDSEFGLRLLRLMTDLSDEEKGETTAAELAMLDLIKNHAVEPARIADLEPANSLEKAEAFKLAAETAAKFKQIDAAMEFRQQLLVLAPADAANRIEFARLLAAKQNLAESFEQLFAVFGDKDATRKLRWLALLSVAEIAGERGENWQLLKTRAENLQANDAEMRTALQALELKQTGRASEAVGLLREINPNQKTANLSFLEAVWAKEINQLENAREAFLRVIKTDQDAEIAHVLNSPHEAQGQLIALNVLTKRSRAALKLAEQNANLIQTGSGLKNETRAGLLQLLSQAAEQTDDFRRAAEFERTRFDSLTDEAEKQASRARIEQLRERGRLFAERRFTRFQVNQNNISD